jgi:hypothetical protein
MISKRNHVSSQLTFIKTSKTIEDLILKYTHPVPVSIATSYENYPKQKR